MKTNTLFLVFIAILFLGCNDEIVTNEIDTQSISTEQAEKLLAPLKNYSTNLKLKLNIQ